MTSPKPSYDRIPSTELRSLLLPDGFLGSLPTLNRRRVSGTELDVHLRVGDEVQVYCGLTRLLDVRRTGDGMVVVSAHPAYRQQDCGRNIFGRWNPDVPDEFDRTLDAYLENVAVSKRHVAGEGSVQCPCHRGRTPGALLPAPRWLLSFFARRRASPGRLCQGGFCLAKPIPKWDVHFGSLEDDLKDSPAPHTTFAPQLEATGDAVQRYVHPTLASV